MVIAGCGGSTGSTTAVESSSFGTTPDAAEPSAPAAAPALSASQDSDQVERSASTAVTSFFAALSEQDYNRAWSRLTRAQQTRLGGFARWKSGYATTRVVEASDVSADALDPDHASVAFILRSTDIDACDHTVRQRFAGSVDVVRSDGVWRIRSSKVRKTAGESPVTAASDCAAEGATDADASQAANDRTPTKVCSPALDVPAITVPALTVPATTIPAVDIPAMDVNGHHYPARHYPARRYPARHYPSRSYPGRHYPARCFDAPAAFAPSNSTVLDTSGYDKLDVDYSPKLTTRYWSSAGSQVRYPDYTAPGFAEFNAAGFPKNQYVAPYLRRDGTRVSGYWRNSPHDGLPTCRITSC